MILRKLKPQKIMVIGPSYIRDRKTIHNILDTYFDSKGIVLAELVSFDGHEGTPTLVQEYAKERNWKCTMIEKGYKWRKGDRSMYCYPYVGSKRLTTYSGWAKVIANAFTGATVLILQGDITKDYIPFIALSKEVFLISSEGSVKINMEKFYQNA